MATTVEPILASDLPAVGRFLHEGLAKRISPEAWVASLSHRWAADQPNHGMQLRDGDKLVGVICAVYSDQLIDGKLERFCNPHSWYVQDAYRHASISVLLPLIKQRGYHFTMFTPNPKVAQVFLGLRFKLLDDGLFFAPNLPLAWLAPRQSFAEHRLTHIADRLDGDARAEFEAHRSIPWLRFVAFGVPGDACLVIYKLGRWKKMRCAFINHVSNPATMARHGHVLRQHLLLHSGALVSRIEARFTEQAPPLAHRTRRTQPKLVSTRSLPDSRIRDVYSELVALDL